MNRSSNLFLRENFDFVALQTINLPCFSDSFTPIDPVVYHFEFEDISHFSNTKLKGCCQ